MQCFRKAAELGCKRFRLKAGADLQYQSHLGWHRFDECLKTPLMCEDMAAICAEWWNNRKAIKKRESLAGAVTISAIALLTECDAMAGAARSFGREHGGQTDDR